MTEVVLASRSPRRLALLRAAGLDPTVEPSDIDEQPEPGESAAALVRRLARAKAAACEGAATVVAADTVVALAGTVLGKPGDEAAARAMLTAESGRTIAVWSGVAVRDVHGEIDTRVVGTFLRVASLTPEEIEAYIATGEPFDAAGGFRIQGSGGALIAARHGCWTNVVGLPMCETAALLAERGVLIDSDGCAPRTTD